MVVRVVAAALAIAACSGKDNSPTQPPLAGKLTFLTQPSEIEGAQAFTPPIQVALQDMSGTTMVDATNQVTVNIRDNPGDARLSGSGTVAAVNGVATFADLSVDRPGRGYTLTVTAKGFVTATTGYVDVGAEFASVSAGPGHTCAATASHVGYCWGGNDQVELGGGSETSGVAAIPRPVLVLGGLTFTAVNAGGGHYYEEFSCGLTTSGVAYCWGGNAYGELGDGTTNLRISPVRVAGGMTFTVLTSGGEFSCGLITTGAAYCWGWNTAGQLGDGTTTPRNRPVAVSGGLRFTDVSVGDSHACGLVAGAAYCWGDNANGALGDGTTIERPSPAPVAGGLVFTAVTAGGGHTCGLVAGAAYCWGRNGRGQLGNGDTLDTTTPVPVAGGLTFISIDAGGDHTCGVATGGLAYCWGENFDGQLGDRTRTPRTTPVTVGGGLSFMAVSAGEHHTCGLSVAAGLYCWGANTSGQLGTAEASRRRTTPQRVVQ